MALAIVLAFALGNAAPSAAAASGGRVLPAQARLFGYSLADMASENALFTYTANDPANYPDTPMQVLYADLSTFEATEVDGCVHATLSNEFTTSVRTFYYVPILNNSDIAPITGDLPTTPCTSSSRVSDPVHVEAGELRMRSSRREGSIILAAAGPIVLKRYGSS